MKIEGDTIVIRVGGGYLTMDEFVQIYCIGAEEQTKAKIASLMTESADDKKFKTFYVVPNQPTHGRPLSSRNYTLEEASSPNKPRFLCNGSPSKPLRSATPM